MKGPKKSKLRRYVTNNRIAKYSNREERHLNAKSTERVLSPIDGGSLLPIDSKRKLDFIDFKLRYHHQ